MERRIARTKEERLAAPRSVSTPEKGHIGTIRRLDCGWWEYVRKDGSRGVALTSRGAVEKLEEPRHDRSTD